MGLIRSYSWAKIMKDSQDAYRIGQTAYTVVNGPYLFQYRSKCSDSRWKIEDHVKIYNFHVLGLHQFGLHHGEKHATRCCICKSECNQDYLFLFRQNCILLFKKDFIFLFSQDINQVLFRVLLVSLLIKDNLVKAIYIHMPWTNFGE